MEIVPVVQMFLMLNPKDGRALENQSRAEVGPVTRNKNYNGVGITG